MLFSSLTFLYAFIPAVALLYFILPWDKWRNGVLIAASLLFYAWADPRALPLLLGTVLVVWLCGLGLGAEKPVGLRRCCFALTLALLIGTLLLYKYLNFLASAVAALAGASLSLQTIALPAAISFTTFQLLSYSIDLKRGTIAPEKNFFRFLLYVSFFPQLMQGPIVRYGEVSRFLGSRETSWDGAIRGSRRCILGLAKKILLADQLAVIVQAVYGSQTLAGTGALWLAGLCFMLQLYFDFSGYTDIALGLGQIFGFSLPENFRYPYAALSVADFWRRWHMTLTRWFRDYVYIPLGGNRVSRWRHLLNILIVWALTGLWHGASWNFVLWGLFNGVLLILERLLRGRLDRVPKLLGHLFTFLLVLVGWVLFSRTDLSELFQVLRGMFLYSPTDWIGLVSRDATVVTRLPLLLPALFFSFPVAEKLRVEEKGLVSALFVNGFFLGLLAVCIMVLIGSSFHAFLYFNF